MGLEQLKVKTVLVVVEGENGWPVEGDGALFHVRRLGRGVVSALVDFGGTSRRELYGRLHQRPNGLSSHWGQIAGAALLAWSRSYSDFLVGASAPWRRRIS